VADREFLRKIKNLTAFDPHPYLPGRVNPTTVFREFEGSGHLEPSVYEICRDGPSVLEVIAAMACGIDNVVKDTEWILLPESVFTIGGQAKLKKCDTNGTVSKFVNAHHWQAENMSASDFAELAESMFQQVQQGKSCRSTTADIKKEILERHTCKDFQMRNAKAKVRSDVGIND